MVYWVSTGLVAIFLVLSAWSYMFHASTLSGIRELGFPDFFRVQLAVLKLIAALVIIIPQIPIQIK